MKRYPPSALDKSWKEAFHPVRIRKIPPQESKSTLVNYLKQQNAAMLNQIKEWIS